ncbi:hypothetical protein [Nocardiopsis ansamitocini]|uniref:Uncharacterized protein n=1 Tax=Nocardiopsis ansamitocini TaxID=1670832 RepID=A0A9W6UK62_9ACTN|nr:hypothetical protein [Nocardiopsis ansamitocini]GLU48755.1 hypothetical protein Nans01_31060 [Nocardiopsis ansamitocini]
MALYRIRMNDGSLATHGAVRVRTDAANLYLEDQTAGAWRPVLDVRIDRVAGVQRRFTENDGSWSWLDETLPAPGGIRAWN